MLLRAVTQRRDDVLFNQFQYSISGDLSEASLEYAWRTIVRRHAAFRTSFIWEGIKQPVQVVREHADLTVTRQDLRDLSPRGQQEALAAWLQNDRELGFDLTRAPLMRVALFRLADRQHRMVWSSHHLIVDRWCLPLLYEELRSLYRASVSNEPPALPEPVQFRDYVAWLQRQNRAASLAFWRDCLHGFRPSWSMAAADSRSSRGAEVAGTTLDADKLAQLRSAGARFRVTPGILLQAALAAALAESVGRRDIAFGVTVSGRPADLPGVEHIVGSLINNVPVRVRFEPEEKVGSLLRSLQGVQQRRWPHEHLTAAQIQRAAGISQPLFDCLLVWLAPAQPPADPDLVIEDLHQEGATGFSVTASVLDRKTALDVRVTVEPRAPACYSAEALLHALVRGLESLLCASEVSSLASTLDLPKDMGSPTVRSAAALALHDADGATTKGAGREKEDGGALADLVRTSVAEVLRLEHVPDDVSFFMLGGDSLSAARLHASIERATRKAVPILALFRAPTVTGMVATLMHEDWPLRAEIITPLREAGTLPPLFFVASPEVSTIGCAQLMHHMQPDRPLLVVQAAPDRDAPTALKPEQLPALAESYVRALLATGVQDPIHLLGMCSGAHLALDMARRLTQLGRRVGFLGVVDTWAMYTVSRGIYVLRGVNLMRWYKKRLREVLLGPQRVRQPLAMAAGAGVATMQDPASGGGLRSPWIADVGWAHRNPRGPKYAGRITVLRLRRHPQQYWRIRDRTLGWAALAEEAVIRVLPGNDHDAITREPLVHFLAAAVEADVAEGGYR